MSPRVRRWPAAPREALRTIILARWASGATSTVIADEINDAYGATLPRPMTRSAVMGIVNRAGMTRAAIQQRAGPPVAPPPISQREAPQAPTTTREGRRGPGARDHAGKHTR